MNIAGGIGQYLGLGKLVGATDLPDAVEVRNYRKGSGGYWGDVYLYNVKIGYLKPGGDKGIFMREAPDPVAPTLTIAPPPVVTTANVPVSQVYQVPAGSTPAPIPVSIPTVQTGSTGTAALPYTSLVESTSSAPAVMPADTGTDTTASESSTASKWIGIAALGIGGYALAKMLGFKSRL